MKVHIIQITIDRKTGQKLGEKAIGEKEVDEDEYHQPLVEIFGNMILNEMNQKK
ncbi:hypothetical protein [Acetivibrio cellulolyticus]|uniref:hypothetical protein n=1 Tax=Acetivibrio cellulolyticus TaxID=35830 RepID=UPI0001E2D97A|nr:hypothetical protein [Acetivibrio cellulolyticus]